MKKYKDFKEYMGDNYLDEIMRAIKPLVIRNKDSFAGQRFNNVTWADLSDVSIDGVTFNDLGNGWLEIRVSAYAEIEISGQTIYDFDSDTISRPYNVFFRAKLENGLNNVSVTKTEEYSKAKFDKQTRLSQDLIPYLYEEDVEKNAEDFLRKYYPEALRTPMPLPVEDIAKSMGMEIYYAPLGNSIFGKTYFGSETVTVFEDIIGFKEKEIVTKPGTMLINNNVYFMRNVGTANNTIIHECVHWDRHRKAFELQRLLDTGSNHISCEIVESCEGITSNSPALKWMEWQANQLAPRILMPAEMTKLTFNQLLLNERVDRPDERDAVILDSAIEKLAHFFGVSFLAAKLRAIELGYEQAQGARVYCNGNRLPSFSFANDVINHDQSFVIDENNLLFNLVIQPELGELFSEGKIVYANCMLCINTPMYICYDKNNYPILTDYALDHVDECCYVFNRKYNVCTDYSDTYYRRCFLCRDIDSSTFIEANYDPNHKTNQDKHERKKELDKICAFTEDMVKVMADLPGSFSKTLEYHMVRKDINEEELADLSNISTVTISKYLNHNEADKKFGNVLAIGKALGLHPMFMEDLIKKAGYSDKKDKASAIVKYLIWYQQDETIEEWQQTFDEAGVKINLPLRKEL